MTDEDFETIYAITFEAPKRIGTMIASTPTGRRGMFYKACVEMPFNQEDKLKPINTKQLGYMYDPKKYNRADAEGWKEFYFPTMDNPEWSPQMERELRGQFSEMAYEHEVLAEFGTETIGVFNKDYVDEASSNGYLLENQPRMNAPIAFGIDWDKFGSQTNIVVLQYDPFDQRRLRPEMGETEPKFGRFKVINHIEVPKSDMHYDMAVKMIVELDAIYHPFAIYPDRGAGEYQIEMLRKALGDKVKGVHLGSSTEVRDPISRTFEKKPLKPFLVSQTTLLLDRGQIRIPNKEVDPVIHRQMTNYRVVRVSDKSQEPVFSNEDEHTLDAMMFAILAFLNEKPDLVQTIFQTETATTVHAVKPLRKDPVYEAIHGQSMVRGRKPEPEWDEPGSAPARKVAIGYRGGGNKQELGGWGKRGSLSKRGFARKGF